jgi:hypothetical protein
MKLFSVINIIIATGLIGAFLFIGLPTIAKVHPTGHKTSAEITTTQKVPRIASEDNILRDKCNSYATTQVFANADESDAFITSCLAGKETSKINVIQAPSTATELATSTEAEPRLSPEELKIKCNDFMTRARFESENAANAFLKNCLAGK